MPEIRSGKVEGLPYSLSRWTDVPADPSKWAWFLKSLRSGSMVAFDPRTATPSSWSLRPEDTLGLIFWTKNPSNLVANYELFEAYRIKVHVTITGWHESERGVPIAEEVCRQFKKAAFYFRGGVIWRFSPVPLVPDVVKRFSQIAERLEGYTNHVYVSFLQANDRVPETRTLEERVNTMRELAEVARTYSMDVRLCNEDRSLAGISNKPVNLYAGVCAPVEDFSSGKSTVSPSEGCGCILMVDPFTINESCSMGCQYCYASDVQLSDHRRNTVKLPIVKR